MNKALAKVIGIVGSIGFVGGWAGCRLYDMHKYAGNMHKKRSFMHKKMKKIEKPEPEETTPPVVLTQEEPEEKSASEPSFEEIVEEEQYSPDHEEDERHIPSKPYIIEPDEYEDDDVFEKVELNLYLGDGILTDDEDEPVTNWKELVGTEALRQIEAMGERVMYVRNEKYYRDYMITAVDGEYGSPYGGNEDE